MVIYGRCNKCGSRCDLTRHHYKDKHLPNGHPKKSKKTKILCATCHYEIDFRKNMNCYHKAMMKKYIRQTNKLYKSFKRRRHSVTKKQ